VSTGGISRGEQLSVVLLTYNCAHRLAPVLDRLAALDVPVVAVDNGSSDGTARVLVARPGLEVVRLERNVGASARNAGVERVRTEFVAFCDDDGWYDADGLQHAVEVLRAYPRLAVVNARISVVGDDGAERLDPICAEMARSPLGDEHGIPGPVLLSFMAGASIMRVAAFRAAGGYDGRFFMGGEEETLAIRLVRDGWALRYLPEAVMHHRPSRANAERLRAYGIRNTIWNAWLHRRLGSAARWTAFIIGAAPKNRDLVRGLALTVRGLPAVLRDRRPVSRRLDAALSVLDERRFAAHRGDEPSPWSWGRRRRRRDG
jgi:GT2 family glycosyltransferase